jgi:hypothetical protein
MALLAERRYHTSVITQTGESSIGKSLRYASHRRYPGVAGDRHLERVRCILAPALGQALPIEDAVQHPREDREDLDDPVPAGVGIGDRVAVGVGGVADLGAVRAPAIADFAQRFT